VNQDNSGMIRATHNNIALDSILASADQNYEVVEVGHDDKRHHKNLVPPHRKKSSHHKNHEASFDFYVFSMMHEPEFCSQKHEEPEGCHHPKRIWDGLTIHGLWPNNDDGSYPQNCSSEQFDLSVLQPIRDELEQQWPNIKALPNSTSYGDFWEHEWSKHGTCTGLSQLDYFSHALKKLIPTPSIMKKAEKEQSFVTKDDLLEFYGGAQRAALICYKGYLSEVRVCHQKETDGNVGDRMDCPQGILEATSCGKKIRIASFGMGRVEESTAIE